MRLKTFTQAYFLIKHNSSYEHSLIRRAMANVNFFVLAGVAAYAWYPSRLYATEKIS
jgi:uncharacterized membrane protein